MSLIDEGIGDVEFLHEDYHIHGDGNVGHFGTHKENMNMLNVTPILSAKTRGRISTRDALRRNQYHVYLLNENNLRIVANIQYNHANEDISLSVSIQGNHGKKVLYIES